MKKLIITIILVVLPLACFAKNDEVYVPKNIDECFIELKKILSQKELEEYKNKSEDKTTEYHFGLGRWIRNNWGLWSGSRLAKYFNEMGIYHPDDMSGIIFNSFYRYLNGTDIKLDEQIKFYQNYWYSVEKGNFEKLRSEWQAEKERHKYSSRTDDYWQGKAGKEIIAMGKRALPFVMEEIKKGDFFFNIPAYKITGIKMKGKSEQEKSKEWVKWWEENKNNTKWNPFCRVMVP